jgi:hypothetical protein
MSREALESYLRLREYIENNYYRLNDTMKRIWDQSYEIVRPSVDNVFSKETYDNFLRQAKRSLGEESPRVSPPRGKASPPRASQTRRTSKTATDRYRPRPKSTEYHFPFGNPFDTRPSDKRPSDKPRAEFSQSRSHSRPRPQSHTRPEPREIPREVPKRSVEVPAEYVEYDHAYQTAVLTGNYKIEQYDWKGLKRLFESGKTKKQIQLIIHPDKNGNSELAKVAFQTFSRIAKGRKTRRHVRFRI